MKPLPSQEYVLGQSARAARRLEVQDAHFADLSERLLDEIALKPGDRVVELGCGPGGFSRRILRRLGAGGVLVAVDSSQGLLAQAQANVAGIGAAPPHPDPLPLEGRGQAARFEPVCADVAGLGAWLDGADVVVARTMLHHVPMVEIVLGRLRSRLKPGTRVGFLEPDFRSPLGRIGYLEATGRPELAPLRIWALAINDLYLARRLSPAVGATLARTLELAGYRNVRETWQETATDPLAIENMLMFYDEVRDHLIELHILTAEQIAEQQRLLRELPSDDLPAAWGIYRVAAEA